MKLRLRVDIFGSDSVIDAYESETVEDEEAEALQEVVNMIDTTSVLSFPQLHSGRQVFLSRAMLDRSVVTCWTWDEDETY